MDSLSEMFDTFFNGRPARPAVEAQLREAQWLLSRAQPDERHCTAVEWKLRCTRWLAERTK